MDEHYFTENPLSDIKEKHFTFTVKGKVLNFTSVSGVFSFEQKVDKASELLIEGFTPTGTNVLDMGCGFGAIGLSLKSMYPQQQILMADINNRAVEYAIKNAKANNLNVEVVQSNLYSELGDRKFDDIVTNPPIAAGKKLNIELINTAYEYLNPNGALWIVAFHNKGGSTLKSIMESKFGNAIDVIKGGGIRVYKSVRS